MAPWAQAGCTPPHLSDVVEIKACDTFLSSYPTCWSPHQTVLGQEVEKGELGLPDQQSSCWELFSDTPAERQATSKACYLQALWGIPQPRVYHSL